MKKLSVLIICLVLFVGILSVVGAKLYYDYEVSKVSKNTSSVTLTIVPGESFDNIANDLVENKIIDNVQFFHIYLKIHNLDKSIEAGEYLVPTGINIGSLAQLLQKGNFYVSITVPAGKRIEEIADIVDDKLSQDNPNKKFNKDLFISLAKDSTNFSYKFFNGKMSLEGFLFPDTYEFQKNVDSKSIINVMLDTFDKKIYSKYSYNTSTGLTFYQSMILSSILEREVSTDEDKKMVSDILIRRYKDDYPLGLDSTLQYFLGYSDIEKTWWRQDIYQKDIETQSEYNTRLNAGFPPTPICNFDEHTIVDSLNPTANKYYYYLSDSKGITHFAITNDEQNANSRKYLNN